MRGVYEALAEGEADASGSSPHARGLRTMMSERGDEGGIIPACAGFTLDVCVSIVHSDGSSPHARGLLAHLGAVQRHRGIIPACAGFTNARKQSVQAQPDHPRMRGVYALLLVDGWWGLGSSPHARGLPIEDGIVTATQRIIPACAGFTRGEGECRVHGGDHPRMRGVYYAPAHRLRRRRGSSPHARGLPGPLTAEDAPQRIIPACAGFTRLPDGHRLRGRDHPRMRGVYPRRRCGRS